MGYLAAADKTRRGREKIERYIILAAGTRGPSCSCNVHPREISFERTRLAGKQTALHKPADTIRSSHYLLTFRIYRHTRRTREISLP